MSDTVKEPPKVRIQFKTVMIILLVILAALAGILATTVQKSRSTIAFLQVTLTAVAEISDTSTPPSPVPSATPTNEYNCSLEFVSVLDQNGFILGSIEDYNGYSGLIVYLTNPVRLHEGWVAEVTEEHERVVEEYQIDQAGTMVPANNQDARSEPITFYAINACRPLSEEPFVDPNTCLFLDELVANATSFGYIMPKSGKIVALSNVGLVNAVDVPEGWFVEWIEWDENRSLGKTVTEYGPLHIEPGEISYSFYAPYDCRPLSSNALP